MVREREIDNFHHLHCVLFVVVVFFTAVASLVVCVTGVAAALVVLTNLTVVVYVVPCSWTFFYALAQRLSLERAPVVDACGRQERGRCWVQPNLSVSLFLLSMARLSHTLMRSLCHAGLSLSLCVALFLCRLAVALCLKLFPLFVNEFSLNAEPHRIRTQKDTQTNVPSLSRLTQLRFTEVGYVLVC